MQKKFSIGLLLLSVVVFSCQKEMEGFDRAAKEKVYYDAFPDITRLSDGRIACVFYRGHAHVSFPEGSDYGGRIMISFSDDEGLTWTAPDVVYDGLSDDRDPSINQLPNGDLICNFFSKKNRKQRASIWTIRSHDMGYSWEKPRKVIDSFATSSPVRLLSNDMLIFGVYTIKDQMIRSAVLLSSDLGYTWNDPVYIKGDINLDELDVIELSDGTLYASIRNSYGHTMRYSRSYDGGITWEKTKPLPFQGNSPYLHYGPDSTIFLGHRLPFTNIRYSKDNCATWSRAFLVAPAKGAYPSMVNLYDGAVLIAFYDDGSDKGSRIKFKKFFFEEDSLLWGDFSSFIDNTYRAKPTKRLRF